MGIAFLLVTIIVGNGGVLVEISASYPQIFPKPKPKDERILRSKIAKVAGTVNFRNPLGDLKS